MSNNIPEDLLSKALDYTEANFPNKLQAQCFIKGVGFAFGFLRTDLDLQKEVREPKHCKHGVLAVDRCFECDPNIGQVEVVE